MQKGCFKMVELKIIYQFSLLIKNSEIKVDKRVEK